MNILKYKQGEEASKEARSKIVAESTNEQLGLYSPYEFLNISVGKYFRFGQVNLIAGMSGSGKSYFMTSLRNHFLTSKDNAIFRNKIVLLHFGYEMKASEEIIRGASTVVGVSYEEAISAKYDKNLKQFLRISENKKKQLLEVIEKYKNLPIFYFEIPGTLEELYATYKHFTNKHPDKKVVVTLDHSLLSKKDKEKGDGDIIANTAKIAIRIAKEGAMVFILNQLNNSIEDSDRLKNPRLHFPMKSDIYFVGQLYWACDNVFVYHRPELLGLKTYGSKERNTDSLVHIKKIKGRYTDVADIFLRLNKDKGRLEKLSSNMKIS